MRCACFPSTSPPASGDVGRYVRKDGLPFALPSCTVLSSLPPVEAPGIEKRSVVRGLSLNHSLELLREQLPQPCGEQACLGMVTWLVVHQGPGGSSSSLTCREVLCPLSFPPFTTTKPEPEVQWNSVSSQLWSRPGLFSSSHTPTPSTLSASPVGLVLKIQPGSHLLSSSPAASWLSHRCLAVGSHTDLPEGCSAQQQG